MDILVTGATGGYGGSVIDHLLKKGIRKEKIAALARNPDKASGLKTKGISLLKGDYDEPCIAGQGIYRH